MAAPDGGLEGAPSTTNPRAKPAEAARRASGVPGPPVAQPPVAQPPVAQPPVANVAELVRLAARSAGERPALIVDGRTMTWAGLDEAVERLAHGLRSAGLSVGDRVAIVLGTSLSFVVTYFAVLRAGGVAVPTNPALTAVELRRVLADAGASMVVVGTGEVAAVRTAAAGDPNSATPLIMIDGDAAADGERRLWDLAGDPWTRAERPDAPVEPLTGGEDVAVLLFTSGTSGRPRAAMLSHRALLANLEQVLALGPVAMRPDDVVLGLLPLFHVYGLNAVLGMAARTGACVVLCPRFDPRQSLEVIHTNAVTVVPAAPPLLIAWSAQENLRSALRSVRLIASGSAALPITVLEEFQTVTGLRVHEGYGLTEAAPIVSSTLASDAPPLGSVGRPLPGVEVRLVDERFEAPEEGDSAEIAIRGANLFSGYWPDGSSGPDEEGWWRTGDVAFQDAAGNLTLVDRIRDLVIVSGFNVYPREVEDALREHSLIAEAAVVGVAHPYTGEAVKAFVVARPGATLTTEDVVAHCRRRLARFKCPTIVSIVEELPHTATGKIAKGRLRSGDQASGGQP